VAERKGPLLIALAVVEHDGKWLVARRQPGAHLEGLWEIPGGKVEWGEDPEETARRELLEEHGLSAGPLALAAVTSHVYRDGVHVVLLAYRGGLADGETPGGRGEHKWVEPWELHHLPMPSANWALLASLVEDLGDARKRDLAAE
jgi:8-oxo-dGTP diphosphatase